MCDDAEKAWLVGLSNIPVLILIPTQSVRECQHQIRPPIRLWQPEKPYAVQLHKFHTLPRFYPVPNSCNDVYILRIEVATSSRGMVGENMMGFSIRPRCSYRALQARHHLHRLRSLTSIVLQSLLVLCVRFGGSSWKIIADTIECSIMLNKSTV